MVLLSHNKQFVCVLIRSHWKHPVPPAVCLCLHPWLCTNAFTRILVFAWLTKSCLSTHLLTVALHTGRQGLFISTATINIFCTSQSHNVTDLNCQIFVVPCLKTTDWYNQERLQGSSVSLVSSQLKQLLQFIFIWMAWPSYSSGNLARLP